MPNTVKLRVRRTHGAGFLGALAVFAPLWGMTGFFTGTLTLLGPVRWTTDATRASGWSAGQEDLVVRGVILTYVILSALLAAGLTRVVRRSSKSTVRIGVPLVLLALTVGAVWVWMTPSLVNSGAEVATVSEVSRFTFGPYPERARLQQLHDDGYTAVISLLHPAVVPFEPKLLGDERRRAADIGIEVLHLPMLPWIGNNAEALAAVRDLARSGEGRYYVHCYLGRDRVGIVKRVVEASAPSVAPAPNVKTALAAWGDKPLERGAVRRLAPGVFLTPYPTDEEMVAFVLGAHGVRNVVSLLDPDNPDDLPWIEKEAATFSRYEMSFTVLPISWQRFDPEQAFEAAEHVRDLERPILVHAFRADGTAAEAFAQAWEHRVPPLSSASFETPMEGGEVHVVPPYVAVGPRPTGPEFGSYLKRRGIRAVAWVGDGHSAESEAADEASRASAIVDSIDLAWRSFDEVSPRLHAAVARGGPWYLYGPGASVAASSLEGQLGGLVAEARRVDEEQRLAATREAERARSAKTPVGRVVDLVTRMVPTPTQALTLVPFFLLYAVAAATLAGWLRTAKGVRTPYTRKVFHILVFTVAGLMQATIGLPGVVLFGSVVCSVVLYAIYRGDGFAFYEAMARETDAPRRTMFILVPMVTTALGGVASNLLFPGFAFVGYLVCGWGDAAGEPVGARWGKHPYRVPSIGGVPAKRSVEGSIGVWLAGSIAAGLGLWFAGMPVAVALGAGFACGLCGALVEAVSNHGLDNFTIQVAATIVAGMLLS